MDEPGPFLEMTHADTTPFLETNAVSWK
jgi:hypothetical protein